MRKICVLVAILFGVLSSLAETTTKDSGKEKSSIVICSGGEQARPQRAPSNVDIILVIGEEEVTILFRGDFGIGSYQLADASSGTSVSNVVNTYSGYSEIIPFSVNESSCLEFSIEFEDGSWSHLSWN